MVENSEKFPAIIINRQNNSNNNKCSEGKQHKN